MPLISWIQWNHKMNWKCFFDGCHGEKYEGKKLELSTMSFLKTISLFEDNSPELFQDIHS